jgi:hypothetical protein
MAKNGRFLHSPSRKNVIPVQGVSFCPMLGRRERVETRTLAKGCFWDLYRVRVNTFFNMSLFDAKCLLLEKKILTYI